MSEEQELEIAADGIEEAIASHTVAIVAGTGERELREIATGTAVSFRGSHFFLTARPAKASHCWVLHGSTIQTPYLHVLPSASVRAIEKTRFRRSMLVFFETLVREL